MAMVVRGCFVQILYWMGQREGTTMAEQPLHRMYALDSLLRNHMCSDADPGLDGPARGHRQHRPQRRIPRLDGQGEAVRGEHALQQEVNPDEEQHVVVRTAHISTGAAAAVAAASAAAPTTAAATARLLKCYVIEAAPLSSLAGHLCHPKHSDWLAQSLLNITFFRLGCFVPTLAAL